MIEASFLDELGLDDLLERMKRRRRALQQSDMDALASYSGTPAAARPLRMTLGLGRDEEERWRKRRRWSPGTSAGPAHLLGSTPAFSAAAPTSLRSAADMRQGLARGSQGAMVKLVSYASGSSRTSALLSYQSRQGQVTLQREDHSEVSGAEAVRALANEWADASAYRAPSNDVLMLKLTPDSFVEPDAVDAALRQGLSGHRYAWTVGRDTAGRQRIDVVMTAASSRREVSETGKRGRSYRVFDTPTSLRGLERRLDEAFGQSVDMEERGFAHGVEGAARYLSRLTSGGREEAHLSDGKMLRGHEANLAAARSWKRDMRSQEQRDVAHIVLSARPGTDTAAFVSAARATLETEFAGHAFAFALHQDSKHVHVHAVVRLTSDMGRRLRPGIQDFKRWRETLASKARERGIAMEATSRFERANPPSYKLKDIRRVEKGIASERVRQRVDAVRTGAVHVPLREEGKRRAVAVAQGWSEVAAIASQAVPEVPVEPGVLRLYRAERPGTRSSAAIFTRDRAEAVELAQSHGGLLGYVDVGPADMHRITPARSQSNSHTGTGAASRFVVSRELADTVRPLPPAEAETATVLEFRRRSETAVRLMERFDQRSAHEQDSHREQGDGSLQGRGSQIPAPLAEKRLRELVDQFTKEAGNMANLNVMKTSFADMNEQMEIIKKHLPSDRQPQIEELHGKLRDSQARMLAVQEDIEKKRGAVEGDRFVAPVKYEFRQFVAEERGAVIRYVTHKESGRQAVAFTDHGDKVEINTWKDREAVLAAMQVASQKWGSLAISGTESYKSLAIELAAEHGFKITNPELQEKLLAANERVAQQRDASAGLAPGVAQTENAAGVPGMPQRDVAAPALTTAEAPPMTQAEPAASVPIVDGDKIKPADSERASTLAAMRAAAEKWGTINVSGTARDKAIAVELAAEHGFKITNPELQEQLAAAREKVEERWRRQEARERKVSGFTDGSMAQPIENSQATPVSGQTRSAISGVYLEHGASHYDNDPKNEVTPHVDLKREDGRRMRVWGIGLPDALDKAGVQTGDTISLTVTGRETVEKDVRVIDKATGEERLERRPVQRNVWEATITANAGASQEADPMARSDAEIAVNLQVVRKRTEAEAQREVRQADRSSATHERPFDGGGSDHAYRTQSEAASAVRAERSIEQNPSKPIATDINQSPEIERQRQAQQELLNEKQANRETEARKDRERHKPKNRQ
ncbi:LPD7 domain-containing protein [Rhizobium sp. ZPR3]|uniref:LPD7 domain-containing protein n=2 Tax=unclassified Rhizobium TaxID=2613769 RepID=A0AAU7SRM0_9HYPH